MRDITLLCCSPNLAGIVNNKTEQSLFSVYSYSRIESIERALNILLMKMDLHLHRLVSFWNIENIEKNSRKFTTFHQTFLATTRSNLGSSVTMTSFLIGQKFVLLNQSFLSFYTKNLCGLTCILLELGKQNSSFLFIILMDKFVSEL